MLRLSEQELQDFIAEHSILYGTVDRPGLMLSARDEIVKPFYRRKLISTSTLLPQARRFTTSSRKLLEIGVAAPVVKQIIFCPEYPVHMVVYDRIAGKDFRELVDELGSEQLAILPTYLAELHRLGVFFRAIHLGNLIYDGARVHLVDISDLSVRHRPLNALQRARNLAHLFNAEADKPHFASYGVARFLAEYESAYAIGPLRRGAFGLQLAWSLDAT